MSVCHGEGAISTQASSVRICLKNLPERVSYDWLGNCKEAALRLAPMCSRHFSPIKGAYHAVSTAAMTARPEEKHAILYSSTDEARDASWQIDFTRIRGKGSWRCLKATETE